MNTGSTNIKVIMTAATGLLLSVWVMLQVTGSGGNVIANYYRYMVGAVVILGLLAPKQSVFFIVVFGVYLGILKKFMILDGGFAQRELFFIMGMPAYMLLGACFATFIRQVLGGGLVGNDLKLVVIFAGLSAAIMFLFVAMGKSPVNAVTAGAYINIVWVLMLNFKRKEEINSLIKVLIIALLPAAFYGIYQGIVGLTYLDMLYVESGYADSEGESILVGIEPRPFATFGVNSHFGLSMVLMLVLAIQWKQHKTGMIYSIGFLFVLLISIIAVYHSTNKSAILAVPFLLFAMMITKSRAFFILAMLMGLLFPLWIGFNAGKVTDFTTTVSDYTTSIHQGLTLNTFNVRIKSFENLANPDIYQLFGRDLEEAKADGVISHSMITDIIIGAGTLAFALAIIVFVIVFMKLQKKYVQPILKEKDRTQILLPIAYFLTIMATGSMGANAYSNFPTSLFLWLQLGIGIWWIRFKLDQRKLELESIDSQQVKI